MHVLSVQCNAVKTVILLLCVVIIVIIFLPSVGVPEGVQKLWIAKQLRVRYSVRAVCGRQRVVQQNGIIIIIIIIIIILCKENTKTSWNGLYSSSSFTKLSRSRIALKRWMRTESCWNKKLVSLSSPDWVESLRPSLDKNAHPDALIGPSHSTAIGWNK